MHTTRLGLSRRRFIALSTATTLGATLFHARQLQAADRFGGWPIGIQSFSLRKFDVDQSIRHMQGLGLHFVEFYSKHVPIDSSDEQLAELQKKESHNVIIGKGFLDLVTMFNTLREIDFPADGSISLEYEANADNPIDDIQQCLTAAEDAIAKTG